MENTNGEEKKVEVKHEGAEETKVEVNKEVPAQGEQGKDGVDEAEEAKKAEAGNDEEEGEVA